MKNLKAAATLHSQLKSSFEQARIQQVTFQLQFSALNGRGKMRPRGFGFGQAQREAFGSAARLQKLSQRRFNQSKTCRFQTAPQNGASVICYDLFADIDRITGKIGRISLRDDNP